MLKAVKRWEGEDGKTTLIGAPDANILREAIEELQKKNNSRSSDVFAESESVSRRTCK